MTSGEHEAGRTMACPEILAMSDDPDDEEIIRVDYISEIRAYAASRGKDLADISRDQELANFEKDLWTATSSRFIAANLDLDLMWERTGEWWLSNFGVDADKFM